MKIKFNINSNTIIEITEKDNIATSKPIKKNPVLYVKNETINAPNKQININAINNVKHNKKNFII